MKDWITSGQALTLIDVREDKEWQGGHAATAMHIPRGTLSGKIAAVAPDKTARIVLYCLGGVRRDSQAYGSGKDAWAGPYCHRGGHD